MSYAIVVKRTKEGQATQIRLPWLDKPSKRQPNPVRPPCPPWWTPGTAQKQKKQKKQKKQISATMGIMGSGSHGCWDLLFLFFLLFLLLVSSRRRTHQACLGVHYLHHIMKTCLAIACAWTWTSVGGCGHSRFYEKSCKIQCVAKHRTSQRPVLLNNDSWSIAIFFRTFLDRPNKSTNYGPSEPVLITKHT